MALKDTIKPFFITGAYPSQPQIYSFFDSIRWNDEAISIANVTGLSAALNLKADQATVNSILPALQAPGVNSFNVPAGTLIEKLLIITPTEITFSVGTAPGETDLIGNTDLPIGYRVIAQDMYFPVDTTISFNGVAIDTLIKIYKR